MPIIIEVVNPNPAPVLGGTSVLTTVTTGPKPRSGRPFVSLDSVQVAGLLPFTLCDVLDCRQLCPDNYLNPVFGELVSKTYQTGKTYENDWNHFMVDCSLYNALPTNTTVLFYLEKYINGQWTKKTNLSNNTYGLYHKITTWSGHPSYASYEVNWGAVVFYFGEGCYRVRATVTVKTSMLTAVLAGGTQAYGTFQLPNTACLVGKMQAVLFTSSGNIPGTYTMNQTDATFTQAQNVQYIVNTINAGSYPYTATYINANSFRITGQSYALNNNILWSLTLTSPGCDVTYNALMRYGVNQAIVNVPVTFDRCYGSPTFDLKKWDCFKATGTVKFETTMNGIIGDPVKDYKKHDLCNTNAYDSVRVRGMFGYEQIPNYIRNAYEWGNPKEGLIEQVNDEAVQRYEFNSKFLMDYHNSRLSTFMMMANKVVISDYNIVNSSYDYKQRHFYPDSGYDKTYFEKEMDIERRDKQMCKLFFKRGVQSVSKTNCCPTPLAGNK